MKLVWYISIRKIINVSELVDFRSPKNIINNKGSIFTNKF
jgi:hypothetical protein